MRSFFILITVHDPKLSKSIDRHYVGSLTLCLISLKNHELHAKAILPQFFDYSLLCGIITIVIMQRLIIGAQMWYFFFKLLCTIDNAENRSARTSYVFERLLFVEYNSPNANYMHKLDDFSSIFQ